MNKEEIYNQMIDEKLTFGELNGLLPLYDSDSQFLSDINDKSSKVGIWRQIAFIVSSSIALLYKMFAEYRTELDALVQEQKIHSIQWYKETTLDYLDGKELEWSDGKFQYVILPTDIISNLKIVSNASVTESPGRLNIKVARQLAGVRQPLDPSQLNRLSVYLSRVKDAGNTISLINNAPDQVNITLDVYYDPLVLHEAGYLLLQFGTYPVEVQINQYLDNLEFNGAFIKTFCIDFIQQAPGVKFLGEMVVESRAAGLSFQEFNDFSIATSGYFEINNLAINYIPNG